MVSRSYTTHAAHLDRDDGQNARYTETLLEIILNFIGMQHALIPAG